MNQTQIKILETLLILIGYFLVKRILFVAILKKITKKQHLESRGKTIKQALNVFLSITCILFVLIVWGVNASQVSIFIGSTLTIVGIAFFAQWSLLSNVTSSIILFFSYPIKLNDEISIVEDKEYEIRGRIIKIGLLFVTLRTDNKEDIILPNNLFIQKSIKKSCDDGHSRNLLFGNNLF